MGSSADGIGRRVNKRSLYESSLQVRTVLRGAPKSVPRAREVEYQQLRLRFRPVGELVHVVLFP